MKTIKHISELRGLPISQVAANISKFMDPEYAVLGAWYVSHKTPIKNWSQYYNHILSLMTKYHNTLQIERKIVDEIWNIVQHNKYNPKDIKSLLPLESEQSDPLFNAAHNSMMNQYTENESKV